MRSGKEQKPFFRRWWVWLLVLALCWSIGFLLGRFGVGSASGGVPSELTILERQTVVEAAVSAVPEASDPPQTIRAPLLPSPPPLSGIH